MGEGALKSKFFVLVSSLTRGMQMGGECGMHTHPLKEARECSVSIKGNRIVNRASLKQLNHAKERQRDHMKLHYLPIGLDVNRKKVVVVGGGEVAARKTHKLLSAGAKITVRSPVLCPRLKELSNSGMIAHQNKRFSPDVMENADLIIAATSSRKINAEVASLARKKKIPVCVVDDPSTSDFIFLASASFEDFMITVSTDGNHPGISSRIREFIEDHEIEFLTRIISGKRHHEEVQKRGKVYVVGAGPGNPELLTIRALAVIKNADVIIKDYLVPDEIIRFSSTPARVVSLRQSKKRSAHGSPFRQHYLNQLMVRFAKEGKEVVRLKSGDPLVFGRGGEEVEYLVSRGIPVEVVPGITSALGASASIFLPLTHRKIASTVTIITGQEDVLKEEETTDWRRLPKNGTIVVYMPVNNAGGLQRRLIDADFPGETPVAIVEKATHPSQRVLYAVLSNISNTVREHRITSPAIFFIGETVKISAMTLQCLLADKSENRIHLSSTSNASEATVLNEAVGSG